MSRQPALNALVKLLDAVDEPSMPSYPAQMELLVAKWKLRRTKDKDKVSGARGVAIACHSAMCLSYWKDGAVWLLGLETLKGEACDATTSTLSLFGHLA